MTSTVNSATIAASWTAMDQTYGTTVEGFSLQPIDNRVELGSESIKSRETGSESIKSESLLNPRVY